MKQEDILFSVGFDRKYGDFDFGVRADIVELSPESMAHFREMVIVGIGMMEDMWRRAHETIAGQERKQSKL